MAKTEVKAVTATPTVKSTNRIAVSTVYLHQAIMIPGLLTTEKHLGKPDHKLTLEYGPEGIWVIPNDSTKTTAIIPHANVSCALVKA